MTTDRTPAVNLQDAVRQIVESRPSLAPRTDFEWRNTTDGLVHRLMRAFAEERSAVLAVCDELDDRYINGDGKPIETEYQRGRCAGYSLASHLIRQAMGSTASLEEKP